MTNPNAEQQSFPSKEAIDAAIPKGRLPYIELSHALGSLSSAEHAMFFADHIDAALQDFAAADTDGIPVPPLTPELSAVLQAAARSKILDERRRNPGDTQGNDKGMITVSNNISEAIHLLYAIADHGRTPIVEQPWGQELLA